jgi:hypothetical protein
MGRAAMVIAFGVCVGSWDKLQKFVIPHVGDWPLIGVSGQTSIASAYNAILAACRYKRPVDYLILQHDDLEITDPLYASKFLAAISEPDVALVGVAGGRSDAGLAWWNRDPIGHQLTDSMMIDFGQRSGEVDLLEGSILALSPWAISNLHFDQHLSGFHGYDEIAAQARWRGKKAVVIDVDTHHHTNVGFKSRDSEAEWLRGDQYFREKWGI